MNEEEELGASGAATGATTTTSGLLLNGSGLDLTGQSTEFIQIVPDALVAGDSEVGGSNAKPRGRACLELADELLRHTRFHVLHALAVSLLPRGGARRNGRRQAVVSPLLPSPPSSPPSLLPSLTGSPQTAS